MFRIDDPTAAVSLPTPGAAGTPGYFTEGNPLAGQGATIVTPDWANMVQEELCNLVTAAGLTLAKNTFTQIRDAVKAIVRDSLPSYAADTGSANAYACTLSPAPAAYVDGMKIRIKIANANTGASTINVNTLGNKALTKLGAVALIGGELVAGMEVEGTYDGTRVQITSAINPVLVEGPVKIVYTSTTALTIFPLPGSNAIRVAGALYPVPTTGLVIANTGVEVGGVAAQNLANSSVNDIYLKVVAGVLTPSYYVDAGGGTHRTDDTPGNVGVEVRNNGGVPDSNRSYIGKCRTNGSGQFQPATTAGLINWFKAARSNIPISGTGTSSANTASGSPTELATAARVPILTYADDAVTVMVNGDAANNSVTTCSTYVGIDGSTATSGNNSRSTSTAGGALVTAVATANQLLTEGLHTISPFGSVGSGTGTWNVLAVCNVRG